MKTAMQELIENLQKQFDEQTHPIRIDGTYFLEKEKEQIIEARDGRETSSFTTGKDYYDLNFNHHIKSEPNSYTNFTPHNANAVAEYNKWLKNFTPKQINKMETPLQNLKYYFRNDETITKEELLIAIDELIDNEIAFFINAFEHGYASSGLVSIEQNKAFEAYGKLYNACNP
jgi:hypothetical protein